MWWLNGKQRPPRKAMKLHEVVGLMVLALGALAVAVIIIIYKTVIPR